MRRIFVFLFCFLWVAPVMADTECPVGYGYTPYEGLEYIESTGGQYIDTNFVPNQDTRVVTRVRFNSIANSKAIVFGSGVSGQERTFEFYVWDGRLEFNYGNETTFGAVVKLGDVVDIDFNKNIFNYSINDVQQSKITRPYISFVTPQTLTLFTLHRAVTRENFIDLYGTKIYDNGVLIRDFVPVRRGDGAVGMYDRANGKFYANGGTGYFIAGPSTGENIGVASDICTQCPPNTYKDFVGNAECTPCPDTLSSPSGSTSINDCGRALWIDGKVLFMPSVPRTKHTLNIMDSDGNIFYGNLYSE